MKASGLIAELQRLMEEHGDLDIYYDIDWTDSKVDRVEYQQSVRDYQATTEGVVLLS